MQSLLRRYYNLENKIYEMINQKEFSGYYKVEDFGDHEAEINHTAYNAVWNKTLRKCDHLILKHVESTTCFVDIGCGKGKAIYYYAKKGWFKELEGVELSADLHKRGLLNLQNYNNVTLKNENALEYILPDRKNFICFMFNPFSPEYHKIFLLKNIETFKRNGGYLLLCDDQNLSIASEVGFTLIERLPSHKIPFLR